MIHTVHNGDPDQSDTVVETNHIGAGRADRLREALRSAGGRIAISERAGIPNGTLGHYLRGRDMPSETLVALAAACGVTVEWLATGRGPMRPGQASPPAPAPPAAEAKLFATVDMDLLGECLAVAVEQLRARSPHPSWGRAAQIATLLYDQIKEDRATAGNKPESHEVTYKR